MQTNLRILGAQKAQLQADLAVVEDPSLQVPSP